MAELSKIIAMALAFAESGGGGGTSDYEDLENKPSINSITLVGNKTSMQLGLFQQLTTMPTAGVTYNGKVVQYTGTTNETYTANNFYKCVLEGASYVWVRVDVQPSGMTNPMTTAGDIIVGGTDGTPTKLGIGTSGQVLKVGDNGLEYADDENTDELSELTDVNISSPTNNQVLGYNSTTQKWENQDASSGGVTDVQVNGTTIVTSNVANMTSVNMAPIVRAVIPQVKTTVDATLAVNTIYSLGEQSSLSLVLPTSSIGNCIEIQFFSGSTPTTLSITSSAIISDLDLTPEANKSYILFCEWGPLTTSSEGWIITYSSATYTS